MSEPPRQGNRRDVVDLVAQQGFPHFGEPRAAQILHDKRNTRIIGLSVDSVESHAKWADDIMQTQGFAPNYPMIGDTDLGIAKLYGMLPADASGAASKRTPADNQTARNVFVIGPDRKIKLIIVYPMTTGRNFDEVLRVIDSLQLTARHKVATPVNWKHGEDVIIAGSVTDEDAKKTYPPRLELAETVHPHRAAADVRSRLVARTRQARCSASSSHSAISMVTGARLPPNPLTQPPPHRAPRGSSAPARPCDRVC
jgi:alkyl hydroperoxide reductase subunit AhpC